MAGAGLWLEGPGDQPGEDAYCSAAQWVPASDTSVNSQQFSLSGDPRVSHCWAGGYFQGKSYKLSVTLKGTHILRAEPSEALYTVGT